MHATCNITRAKCATGLGQGRAVSRRWVFKVLSAAINRRSRCGLVRGSPVVSSHFSPGLAPQVGQRTAISLRGAVLLVFMSE